MKKQSETLGEELEILRAEITTIAELEEPSDEDIARSDALTVEFEGKKAAYDKAVDRENRVAEVMRAKLNPSNLETTAVKDKRSPELMTRVEAFDGKNVQFLSRSEARDKALKALETVSKGIVSDQNVDYLSRSFDQLDALRDGDYIARRLLMTENPAYRTGFMKRSTQGTDALLTQEEHAALAEFRDYEVRRAASEGTTTAGGFGVPILIDPTVILTSGALDAPVVRVSRVENITTQIWKGVSSAGMTWSFDAEASAVSDDTPTFAQPTATTYMARGFIPYSIEIGMDYPNFAREMGRLLEQGYTDLLAVKTISGNGTSEPRGIVTALDANTNDEVVTTTDGSFGAVDVFKVWNALPERWRSRATWLMSVSVESAIRQFSTSGVGSYFTVDLTADGISVINGRPVVITDYMPSFSGAVPGTTGAANILVVGDFSNYLIAQRAGMSVEQVPMLFDVTNNLPTGSRGWFAYARVGGNSVNDLGFRLLQNQ